MRESISISRLLSFVLLLPLLHGVLSGAQRSGLIATCAAADTPPASDRAATPEEDDFKETPFTQYGTFNEDKEEEEDLRFMQQGRLFGVSLGLGFEQVDGNRGLLWQGGFPMADLKVHYWFNFHLALDLGLFYATHFYSKGTSSTQTYNVSVVRLGLDLKYYFDTQNLPAPISFVNPYLLGGAGSFTKTETNVTSGVTPDTDTALGVSWGVGLEMAIKPRKIYFALEGKMHYVLYRDMYFATFVPQGIPNLTGFFYTVSGNFLLTW